MFVLHPASPNPHSVLSMWHFHSSLQHLFTEMAENARNTHRIWTRLVWNVRDLTSFLSRQLPTDPFVSGKAIFISGFQSLWYCYPVINGRSLKIQSFKQINQMSSNQHIQLHNIVRSRVLISTTILAGDGQYRFCTISLLATKFYLQFDHS